MVQRQKETHKSQKAKMYEEDTASGCSFDPNNSSMPEESAETVLNINSSLPPPPQQLIPETTHNNILAHVEENSRIFMEEFSCHHYHNNNYPHQEDDTAMEIELQNEPGFNMDHNSYNTCSDNNNNNTTHLGSYEQTPNWDIHGVVHECPDPPPTPDLLNLLHLPRCSPSSVLPNSSMSFTNSLGFLGDLPTSGMDTLAGTVSSVLYDPLFHPNLPPQPPFLRELMLQSLAHGSLFSNGGDEREGSGVLEFSREMGYTRRGRGGKAKGTKHSTTEQDRRIQLNGKYTALRNLVPNPQKHDKASIVGDAIDYIKELRRTVDELKLLVEKKRCGRERSKRQKTEEGAESCNMKLGDPHDNDQSYNNGALRSSWLQRKSKDTEVDVRIIDDEVTIKLVLKKKINLLLFVSKLLDELQLEIHYVSGGQIGNSYSFLFNTKMYEGSCLYASAIASKFIEVLDRQYAAIPPPTSSY